jgi:hypothetical protein
MDFLLVVGFVNEDEGKSEENEIVLNGRMSAYLQKLSARVTVPIP